MSKNIRDFWDLDDVIPPQTARRTAPSKHSTETVEISAPAAPCGRAGTVTVAPAPARDPTMSAEQNGHGVPPVPHAEQSSRGVPPIAPTRRDTRAELRTDPAGDVPLRERPVDPFAPKPPPLEKPEHIYHPEHPFLKEVRIYPWHSSYPYYEQFRTHAIRLMGHEGQACPEAEFFSYMPQYTQLDRAQLRYYLWWRTNFRRGELLPASFSYLLLYLYEQINLAGHIPAAEVQKNILRLWLCYRREHPRLDPLAREWLCDHALLCGLPAPHLPQAQLGELLAGGRLKEFYVSGGENAEEETVAILLFCNNYDYRKSKFYRADTAELYDRVLGGAVSVALRYLRHNEKDAPRTAGVSTISRDAFAGAVCATCLKRRIEVDFSSFSHTHELRYVMTDVLKYCENAIRAAISVKSRLTVYQVSTGLKRELDAYLAEALPKKAPKRSEKSEPPQYEQRYEVVHAPVSPERAAQIEQASWQMTRRLVEAFEGGKDAEKRSTSPTQTKKAPPLDLGEPLHAAEPLRTADPPQAEPPQIAVHPLGNKETIAPEPLRKMPPLLARSTPVEPDTGAPAEQAKDQKTPPVSPLFAAIGGLADFIPLAARGARAEERAYAAAHGEMLDAIADRINTAAVEILGDVILQDEGGFYTVIEDYISDLEEAGLLP